MPENHAPELDLLDVVLDEASDDVMAHVEACDECRNEVAALRTKLDHDSQARTAGVTERRAQHTPLPPREPRVGDLWRASWDDVAQLIIIHFVDTTNDVIGTIAVAELEAADDQSAAVSESVLGWPAVALLTVTAELPARVLDLLLAEDLPVEQADIAGPIVRATDPRAFEHATIREHLGELAAADWVSQQATGTLTDQLTAAWSKPSELAHAIGIGYTEARELLTGSRAPDPAETERLASFGIETAGVAPPPTNAIWAADRPEFRHRWKQLAAAADLTEVRYRWETYTDTQFALAARRTGVDTHSRETWRGRTRELLDGRS